MKKICCAAVFVVITIITSYAISGKIVLTEDDGTKRTFVEQTPATQASNNQEPAPSTQPIDPPVVVPPATVGKTIRVKPESIDVDLASIRNDSVVLFAADVDYIIAKSWTITHDRVRVGVEGEGRARLINNVNNSTISIASSADGTVVENLLISSKNDYKGWPNGITDSGSNTTVRRCKFDGIYTAYNVRPGAKNPSIERSEHDDGRVNYFCYASGPVKNIRIVQNTSRRALLAFFRTNNANGGQIVGNTVIGGDRIDKKQPAVIGNLKMAMAGRITLQACANFVIANNVLTFVEVGSGPLWNNDGFKQNPLSEFLAWRSSFITYQNNVLNGGWINVGRGTVDVVANGNSINPVDGKAAFRIDGAKIETFGTANAYTLPAPVNIVIDGKKVK